MRTKLLFTVVALAALGVLVTTQAATAGGRAETTVTINASGDPQGKVKSPKQSCVNNRKVNLFRVKPGDDDKIGSDTADNNGNWSTGNPGGGGKVYAKAGKTPDCQSDKSPTRNL